MAEILWTVQVYRKTRRERPKSAPYRWLKNIQGTTIGNIWKKLLFVSCRTMPKNPKRGYLGSLNVFYKPKTSKNARGYPLIKFENFRKKNRILPKKTHRIFGRNIFDSSGVSKKGKAITIVDSFLKKAPTKNGNFVVQL